MNKCILLAVVGIVVLQENAQASGISNTSKTVAFVAGSTYKVTYTGTMTLSPGDTLDS